MDDYRRQKNKSKNMRVLDERVALDFKLWIKELLPMFVEMIIELDSMSI